MKTRIFALLFLSFLLTNTAMAEVYAGTTVAAETVAVAAKSGGTVSAVYACAGEIVEEGATLAQLRTNKVYAAENGTVARILAGEGEKIDGTVLELSPVSRYTIYCTVDEAYQSAASTFVRNGESLYIRCTSNGTHRGTGRITQIDAAEYTVEATGGEFYVGETVYLYRDADFTSSRRVGIGTVVSADPQSYEAQGYLTRLHVQEGEYVERGELLYEYAKGAQTELSAPVTGIVIEAANGGDALQAEQTAVTLVPIDQIEVEIQVEESDAAHLSPGDTVSLIYADDSTETPVAGTVERVSQIARNEQYTVRIRPETVPHRLGLTVNVRTGESR